MAAGTWPARAARRR